MRVPAVVGSIELAELAGRGRRTLLTRSNRGVPTLVALSGGSLEFFELDFRMGRLLRRASVNPGGLSLGGVRAERVGREFAVSVGSREVRGEGFLDVLETEVYFVVCGGSLCLAGIGDLVDGVLKVYDIPRRRLGTRDGSPKIYVGRGLVTVLGREATYVISHQGVEVVPGHFRAVVDCGSGTYLLDKDNFLVKLSGGVLTVVGRVYPEVQASCIDGGVVVADAAGVRLAVGGTLALVTRDRAKRVTSQGVTIVAEHPEGVFRIIREGTVHVLSSPMLRSCVAVGEGVVCITDELALLLDPSVTQEVYARFLSTETSSDKYVELVVGPWYPGCRYSASPRVVEVVREVVDGGGLRLAMCPEIPGWEGFVRVDVTCPTYTYSTRELIRSGRVEVRGIRYKALFRAAAGRLAGTECINCYGILRLDLESNHPVPIPLRVLVQGVREPRVELSGAEMKPGLSTLQIEFLGNCSKAEPVYVTLLGSRGGELWEVLTVGYSPQEHVVVDSGVDVGFAVVEEGSRSIIKAPGSHIELTCFDGSRFDGRDEVVVSNCREPAVVKVRREVRVLDKVFEIENVRVLSPSWEKCLQGFKRVSSGGFRADCSMFVMESDLRALARVEYSDKYIVALYLGGVRTAELPLDIPQLATGFAISYGGVPLKLSGGDLLKLALRVAHDTASLLDARVRSTNSPQMGMG
jgi:hypothetical protein